METSTLFWIFFAIVIIFVAVIMFLMRNLKGIKDESKGYRANYPSQYRCLDGDKVRSLSELLIDDFFYRNGVQHKYEDVILKSAEKKYKYDWYLPEIDVYVEFFGFSGKKYHETREKKTNFYRVNNLKMIAIEPKELANITEQIPDKFGKYWEKIAKKRHCSNCGSGLDNRI